jgi:hypothetical protein
VLWWLLAGVVAVGLLVWLVSGLRKAGRVIDNMPQPHRESSRANRGASTSRQESPHDPGTGVA